MKGSKERGSEKRNREGRQGKKGKNDDDGAGRK